MLYNDHRPTTLDEVVGQDAIVRTIDLMLKRGKVPHGLEFSGPRGTGKTTVARLIATRLVGCYDVDVHEIDGASHGKVEDARRIIESAAYMPVTGRHKVFIIDEAHMLSKAAFNALLKTLEEPPPHAIFILCTTEPKKIPETVRSRCISFEFKLIDVEIIGKELERIMRAEDLVWLGGDIEAIAELASGSMRDALTILEGSICGGEVSMDLLRRTPITEMVELIGHGMAKEVLELARRMSAGPAEVVDALVDEFRELLLRSLDGPCCGFDTPGIVYAITTLSRMRPIIDKALLDASLVRLTLAEHFMLDRGGGS